MCRSRLDGGMQPAYATTRGHRPHNGYVPTPYFDAPLPHRLAHRGATDGGRIDENTLAAFELALAQGATHIETDVRATSDGVALVFHDADFARVAPDSEYRDGPIAELSSSEVAGIRLRAGGGVPKLAEALAAFPSARFNIDIKSMAAATATAEAVIAAGAVNRVLISSFSDKRRRSTLAAFEARGAELPATGCGARVTAWALFGYLFSRVLGQRTARKAVARALRGVDAMQVPQRFGAIRVARPGFVAAVRAAGVHVHFWVINDGPTAQTLMSMGASGIVSDDLPSINFGNPAQFL